MAKKTAKKTMTKAEFMATAKPLTVVIGGVTCAAEPREFSTGSVGWALYQKVTVTLPNGETDEISVSANWAVIHSKKWDEGETKEAA
jgi:hypothetical protein